MIIYDLIYSFLEFVFGLEIITSYPFDFYTKTICFIVTFIIFFLLVFYIPVKILKKIFK